MGFWIPVYLNAKFGLTTVSNWL